MNNNSSKQVLLSVIGVAILVVAVVGVSFAFFSYVYNGETANEVETGTIIFKASTSKVELSNVFPTTAAEAGNVATVSISGNTTYEDGIEFVVVAKNVTNGGANTAAGVVPTIKVTPSTVEGVTITSPYDGTAENAPAFGNNTVLARGTIAKDAVIGDLAKTEASDRDVTILSIAAFYDETKYHISENTREELSTAGLLPADFAADGKIIKPVDWNAMSDGKVAYSFTIDIYATQTGSNRLPY